MSFKKKIKDNLNATSESFQKKTVEIKKIGEGLLEDSNIIKEVAVESIKEKGEDIKSFVDNTKESFQKKNKDNKETKEKNKDENNEKIDIEKLLQDSINEYNLNYTELSNEATSLYTQRERSVDLLDFIESLISSIANKPKTFDASIEFIHSEKIKFKNVCDFAKEELELSKKTAISAAGGVAAAGAVAGLAPSAAIWVATTFGTASTGTAISTLSGAAASKAALAWLGGGALVSGGGGVAAGKALLALAGPIGWTIAGASLLTSVTIFTLNKTENKKKKKEEIDKIKNNTKLVKESYIKTNGIMNETSVLRRNLAKLFLQCMPHYGKSFTELDEEIQLLLGTLVNNSKSLAATLEKTI